MCRTLCNLRPFGVQRFRKKEKEDAYVRYVLFFQCQQTAGNTGCIKTGVCGKQPSTALLQDLLVEELIRLSHAAMEAGVQTDSCTALLADGLFTTLTNVNFDDASIKRFTDRVRAMRRLP